MDLGKMLAEALANAPAGLQEVTVENGLGGTLVTRSVDLSAAAETFLAKVREAEQTETGENNPPAALYGNVE